MYAVYRQAHTPTSVEFSVYCNFISSKEKNLVVAGTSQLFVYRIIHDVEVTLTLRFPFFFVPFFFNTSMKGLFDVCHICVISEYFKG